jgi:hypothetical protein
MVWGAGMLDSDPQLVDPNSDYHLTAGSPCRDAGDPLARGTGQVDIDSEPRLMGGQVDIGVDEFTAAFLLYGDLDCNGRRDFADINPFVLLLSDPTGYRVQYPDCNELNGDCNKDGQVDFKDINPFVALLTGG